MGYQTIFTPFHYNAVKRFRFFFVGAGILLWLAATLTALAPLAPHLLYRLSPKTPSVLANTIGTTVRNLPPQPAPVVTPRLPPQDPKLPAKNYLVIPKIGVNGLIHEGDNWEEILKNGVWRDPDLFTPETGRPVILAAHRWGYVAWSNTFRRLNSFYSLPKLKPGDELEIVWNQRRFTYQVTDVFEGELIDNFDADLILYTCQLWNSPVRIFVHANRTN